MSDEKKIRRIWKKESDERRKMGENEEKSWRGRESDEERKKGRRMNEERS